MASIKKPVIITKPASLTGSIKQTTITTPTKKPLKPELALRKTPIAAPKSTSLANKIPSKPVVSKMVSTKVSAAIVDKPISLTPPAKTTSKPVVVKTSVKRAVADTTSDKEPATTPVRKLSIPTGLTKSTKVLTKPVATTPVAKIAVKTKSALTDKLPAKPVAEKLPAKAKLTSSTLPSKTSTAVAKPVTPSTPVRRPLTPRTVDAKKTAASRPLLAKSVSKTATSAKPVSIITPIAAKKIIKKCDEVQICDADSTSVTMSEQPEMQSLEFGTPDVTSEFNELQAYKVAEQMMEALGPAVIHQDALLEDSVIIDMSAMDASLTVLPDEKVEESEKTEEQTTDCEPARVDDCLKETEDTSAQDLISFVEVAQEESASGESGANTSEGVAEDMAVQGADITVEATHDQEDIESSVEDQVSEPAGIPSDEGAVSGDESEPEKEMTSFEPCNDDETQQVEKCKEFVDDSEVPNNQQDLTCENEIEDKNVHDESCSVEAQVDENSSMADPEIIDENDKDVQPAQESQLEQPEDISQEVDPTTSIDILEDHFCADSDPASVTSNSECNSDDFVVVKLGAKTGDEDPEQVALIVDDSSVMDAEKSADSENAASADSVVSYAHVVKQSATDSAGDFESLENVELLIDLEVEDNTSQQICIDNFSAEIVANDENVAVTEAAAGATAAADAAGDAEATGAAAVVEASEATGDGETAVGEQTVTVETLLGSMIDEVQQELDAGMEHSYTVDEDGYMKVQKKRNKRNNKRHRRSLKALQKENTDFEPATEVQESQDDLQVYQKRRNSRRAKNLARKQNRRFSEPYSNFHCYSTPVWKSYYVEH